MLFLLSCCSCEVRGFSSPIPSQISKQPEMQMTGGDWTGAEEKFHSPQRLIKQGKVGFRKRVNVF